MLLLQLEPEIKIFQSTYSHEGYESLASSFCMERYSRSVRPMDSEMSG